MMLPLPALPEGKAIAPGRRSRVEKGCKRGPRNVRDTHAAGWWLRRFLGLVGHSASGCFAVRVRTLQARERPSLLVLS